MVDCLALSDSGGVLVELIRHHNQLGNWSVFPSDSFFVQSHFLVLVAVHVRFERRGSLAIPIYHTIAADLVRVPQDRAVLQLVHSV